MPSSHIAAPELSVAQTSTTELSDDEENIQLFNWRALLNWRALFQRKNILRLVILILVLAVSIIILVERNQFAIWLEPVGQKLKALPAGWLIPIAILFVLSFPPLFGHEFVALIVGLVWGFGIGFAIVAAGTILGEIGTFFAFKSVCSARGEKIEKKNLRYAALAKVIREGGFLIAVITRYSIVPTHLTTALYATCGLSFWIFLAAAVIGLPKQMAFVYLGVILQESAAGTETAADAHLATIITIITAIVTIIAAHYIFRRMRAVLPMLVEERRAKRLAGRAAASDQIPLHLYTTPFPSVTDRSSDSESGTLSSDTLYEPPLQKNAEEAGFRYS